MSAAARGVFAHRFKLGGDVAQGHLRIGHGNADDERHQAVFGRFATRALDQIRLDKVLLDEAADGTPQTLDVHNLAGRFILSTRTTSSQG